MAAVRFSVKGQALVDYMCPITGTIHPALTLVLVPPQVPSALVFVAMVPCWVPFGPVLGTGRTYGGTAF